MDQVSVFDINKICRVCLEEGQLVSIYSTEYAISPLDMIVSCTSVKITDNDELPSSICNNCIYRLGVAYQFKQQCENSDMRLRECLGLELCIDDVETVENDKDVKHEKQVVPHIDTNVVHQLVTNNDSATQVKDEEIFAAMNAVCEIFGDSETSGVNLLHDGPSNTTNSLIETIPMTTDDELINSSYLSGDVLNDHAMLVRSHEILEQRHDLLQQNNDTILESDNQSILENCTPDNSSQMVTKRCLQNQKNEIELPLDNGGKTDRNKGITKIVQKEIKSNNNKKTRKKRPSKALKTKEDLDKFLEQRKIKRKLHQQQCDESKVEKKKKEALKFHDQCFDCGKKFAYSGYLDAHIRTHTGERPYHCQLCKLKFAQAGNLALHMRVHTGERPYQCEICSKLFTTSSNLKAHQRIHSETRNYKCTQCDRAFKSPAELVSHAGTHTGVKNHVCKLCGKAFYKTSYLNVHFRTVHVGEKRHRCSECGKEFSNSSNLTCHFRIHTGEKPFSCRFCNAKFNQSSALIRHTKQHTNGSKSKVNSKQQISTNSQEQSSSSVIPIDSITVSPSDSQQTMEQQQQQQHSQSLPNIITIPSSIITDYKTGISDLAINSFSSYMKLPEHQHQQSILIDFTKSTMMDYSKNQQQTTFDFTS